MKIDDYQFLVGKYLNGYKIVKVEKDPFYKDQINLWTDEWKTEAFNDRCMIKFFIRTEGNSAKIYQEQVDKENTNLKQALNKIREYVKSEHMIMTDLGYVKEQLNKQYINDILQIIDEVEDNNG